jgi:uncharacterized protein YqfA (UPF0365 family)
MQQPHAASASEGVHTHVGYTIGSRLWNVPKDVIPNLIAAAKLAHGLDLEEPRNLTKAQLEAHFAMRDYTSMELVDARQLPRQDRSKFIQWCEQASSETERSLP